MIPDLVRATVDLHVVQTQIQLDAWLHIAANLDKETT